MFAKSNLVISLYEINRSAHDNLLAYYRMKRVGEILRRLDADLCRLEWRLPDEYQYDESQVEAAEVVARWLSSERHFRNTTVDSSVTLVSVSLGRKSGHERGTEYGDSRP